MTTVTATVEVFRFDDNQRLVGRVATIEFNGSIDALEDLEDSYKESIEFGIKTTIGEFV